MTNPIFASWCISNNIGDALTPWLIERITGNIPIFVPYAVKFPKYMVSGSILNHAVEYTTVWGAGIADKKDPINGNCNILAVRGPVTASHVRLKAGINVEIVGDPAWLMPLFFSPERNRRDGFSQTYKVGICPHYLHQAEVSEWIGNMQIKLLNVFSSPETFVKEMRCCDVIYSSSLHGLAIADAYGVPSRWIECTAPLGGDGMKFYDHLIVRDCLCEKKMAVMDKLKLFVNFDLQSYDEFNNDINDDKKLKLNEPIKPIHLQQLSRDVDALRAAIINMPVPLPEARHEIRNSLMSVCPFKPEPLKETK